MNNSIGYLTKIPIDESVIRKRKLIDLYQWHQFVWTLFPNKTERDFLFELEIKKSPPSILILSKTPPTLLSDLPGETQEISDHYFDHETYAFSLTCNPTIKKVIRLEDGSRKKNGTRIGILKQEECLKWLEGKALCSGFKLLNIKDFSYEILEFYKGNRQGKIASVNFSGILQITEKNLFIQSLFNGFGSAKGFGFGLIKIIPIIGDTYAFN